MITIRSPLTKTFLLLTLTTLTIGLGTSFSSGDWNSPEDKTYSGDVPLNITDDNSGSDFNFSITGQKSLTKTSPTTSNGFVTDTFSPGDGDSGDYQVTAESSAGDLTRSFSVDIAAPNVNFPSDIEYVGSSPTITVTIEDQHSGVESVDASADNSATVDNIDDDDCDGDSTCDVDIEIDTSDLDQGDEFDLDVTPNDTLGNSGTSTENDITFDSEWDGDDSASVEWDDSGSNVLTGSAGEDQDVLISFQPDSVSETTITCEVGGDEVDTDKVDASDEEENFYCGFDSEDYSSSVYDLTVDAEDEAGNTQTLVDGKELIWDTERPSIDNLEQPEGVSTFNSGFDLNVLISDDASGIEYLEYYFDANTDSGEGTSVSLDDNGATTIEKTFSVNPELERGSHTVYVRSEDNTGQISDVKEFDFEYYPDAEADIILDAPESLEVVSGTSKSFILSIENGAPFFLNGVEVSGSGPVWGGTKTASDLEPGDSVERNVTVDASNLDVGVYDLVLQTANYDSSNTIEVIVRATESQQQNIDTQLQDWESKRTQLKENISSIGTLEEENGNITQFTNKVEQAKEAAEQGNYYQAKAYLGDIDESFDQASQTFSDKQELHKKNQRNTLFMILFGAVVLIGGGAAGFILYRDEGLEEDILEDILPEDVTLPNLPEFGVMDKIRELLEDVEEEKEDVGYKFEDFA